ILLSSPFVSYHSSFITTLFINILLLSPSRSSSLLFHHHFVPYYFFISLSFFPSPFILFLFHIICSLSSFRPLSFSYLFVPFITILFPIITICFFSFLSSSFSFSFPFLSLFQFFLLFISCILLLILFKINNCKIFYSNKHKMIIFHFMFI